ncbi:hypothetical protein [Liquorilactobacillus oeni]|uniref:ABM domain-containing protein n=1 Tax=Liquorilactobacillus oeni DSM 19972 TaxID=1423777 RepID=A0A0R1M9F6_9LACO|nr:hypothetical protein [Liquorilactobacillus oeni]KRL04800.1 hypothetical protein FD46_GL001937 [Liquorilactobacillus oeni DSM 19972]
MDYIYITFGSDSVLKTVQDNYSKRRFLKLTSFENNQKHALIDISNQETVFESGVGFKILKGKFSIQPAAKYYFNYFMLDEQEQKKWLSPSILTPAQSSQYVLCQSLKHDFNFLIITTWKNDANYLSWVKNHPFLSDSNGTFNASYKRVFTDASN